MNLNEIEEIEDRPNAVLAGEIGIESAFLIELMRYVFVIHQSVGDQMRYATLQWHDKEPGKDIHEYTLALTPKQALHFNEQLRGVAADTDQNRQDQQQRDRLNHRVEVLERENDLLRENLSDLRREQQIRAA